jgi:NAD(P)-dependent dehydrogenase (short-subunit alcohol dehydrogenase family)
MGISEGGLTSGKVVLVTGAAQGIGEASARLFATEGAAMVVVADLRGDLAEEVASSIRAAGGQAESAAVDVTDEASVAALIGGIVERHGRLDCAHNNAGISGDMAAFTDLTLESWDRMIAINLTSVFLCLKHELRQMKEQGSGAIVNTSSGAGVVGFAGLPHYVAAKHGVVGLTKTAAQEFARNGIRVNAILPGTTNTPMIRGFVDSNPEVGKMIAKSVGRGVLGEPDEVAQAAVWLCSDRASFVSGESMLVDGATVCR